MMFAVVIFIEVQWTVNANEKYQRYWIWMRKTRHQFVSFLRFLAKWSRDISRDLLTQYLYFKILRAISSLCAAKFDSAP